MRSGILVIVLLLLSSRLLYGQADTSHPQIFKWNPRIGEYPSFLYEKLYKPGKSYELGAGYISQIYVNGNWFGALQDVNGLSVRFNINHYKKKHSLSGFYYGPTLLLRAMRMPAYITDTVGITRRKYEDIAVLEPGFRAGTQFYLSRHITGSVYMGLGLRFKYTINDALSYANGLSLVGFPIMHLSGDALYFNPAVHVGLNIGWSLFGIDIP